MIKLFTTNTCPTCKVIKNKLDKIGIGYVIESNLEVLEKENIQAVPILEIDNKRLSGKQIIEWLRNQGA